MLGKRFKMRHDLVKEMEKRIYAKQIRLQSKEPKKFFISRIELLKFRRIGYLERELMGSAAGDK